MAKDDKFTQLTETRFVDGNDPAAGPVKADLTADLLETRFLVAAVAPELPRTGAVALMTAVLEEAIPANRRGEYPTATSGDESPSQYQTPVETGALSPPPQRFRAPFKPRLISCR